MMALRFDQYPQMQPVGGSAIVQAPGYSDPVCRSNAVIVVQVAAGQFQAFQASCTHNCCPVQFDGKGFICPCHGSTFDLTGKVTGGPARAPLEKLDACSDECGVYVTLP
jgi:thiosulfate dehydrogenase [quinone] large subunit